ncbi:MAG: hypothetical protein JXA18_08355 [Chitinispirillaceae bacterium]|nr:hypothetical protein [Chitinispirillaceae bacterium]
MSGKNAPMATYGSKINEFLLNNGLLIKNNPAISPDLTLDFTSLLSELRSEANDIAPAMEKAAQGKNLPESRKIILWPQSSFSLETAVLYVVESKRSGDCALVTASKNIPDFEGAEEISQSLIAIPLLWENLIKLKNAVLDGNPSSTIFPIADPRLQRTSLGIGARFTTLHWPAVAWVMKALRLPLTANQNSIPRELVYNVNAMLANRLQKVPFPFIGGSVPEGHQGQSVMGMSHASIITLLKLGFHHNNIPWGFNADHQPIGGRFDAIEAELVEGSLFASYITYDLSPELALHRIIDDPVALEAAFKHSVDPAVFDAVVRRLSGAGLELPALYIKKMVTYLMPAMEKMKRRDRRYAAIRAERFTSETGRRFIRELSIDELPGETTVDAFAVCLALTEALGVQFDFVAPNFGFQKNIPYADTTVLREKLKRFSAIARIFNVSIGFHSGSGKSAENYRIIGSETGGNFEIKTSGRYTYEMGRALSRSNDPADRQLWMEWYEFTKDLTVAGAFSADETAKRCSREFVSATFAAEGISADGAFDSPDRLKQALDSLQPSPDHVFWFEYNFLFVLAAKGSITRLGDHSIDGYAQRSRFYAISDEARLLYARGVATYIIFLAESTGIASDESVAEARKKLADFTKYNDLLADIA